MHEEEDAGQSEYQHSEPANDTSELRESIELLRHFRQIVDPKVRFSIYQIVKTLAETQS